MRLAFTSVAVWAAFTLAASAQEPPSLGSLQELPPQVTGSAWDTGEPTPPPPPGRRRIRLGDMTVDVPAASGPRAAAHGFVPDRSQPWPGGVIPMVFEAGFTAADFQMINQACHFWSRAANVRCVDRSNQLAYVRVTKSEPGCFVNIVGQRNGPVTMNLAGGTGNAAGGHGSHGCFETRIIAHEIGHLLGYLHEQSRPDRDQYIDLFPSNMTSEVVPQYAIEQGTQPLTPYDFGSIMHYAADAGTSNGYVVMWPKNPYGFLGTILGKTLAPSVNDGAAMRAIYGAPTGQYAADRPGHPVLIGNVTATNPVQLSWIPDAHTPQPTSYRLYVSSQPDWSGNLGIYDMGRANSIRATAAAGQTLYVSVAAMNQVGGNFSNQIAVRVGGTTQPQPNPGLSLSATVTRRDVALRWTGATNVVLAWTLRAPGTIDGTIPLAGSQALFQNLPVGTYHLAISPNNGATWSNIVRIDIR